MFRQSTCRHDFRGVIESGDAGERKDEAGRASAPSRVSVPIRPLASAPARKRLGLSPQSLYGAASSLHLHFQSHPDKGMILRRVRRNQPPPKRRRHWILQTPPIHSLVLILLCSFPFPSLCHSIASQETRSFTVASGDFRHGAESQAGHAEPFDPPTPSEVQ